MLDRTTALSAQAACAGDDLVRRRLLFAALVAATMAALLWLAATALSPGGLSWLDAVLLALFAVTLPWTVIGFWNAAIGFLIMRFAADPVANVFPAAARIRGDEPITASTAILVCIRNERPERVIRNLEPMLEGLAATGLADRFHLYVLSDSSEPDIIATEESLFAAAAARWRDRIGFTYRRRATNAGFKAGNIRDFCDRWGADHDFALTLDADSFMPAAAILRLVRIMQAEPGLGILQGLILGLPSTSAFARLFQFGMRLGMRSYTFGSIWWQGDCGQYWGHNALLRLAPFIAHCRLPMRAVGSRLGRHILSHDMVEAVLMRRAGYAVQVLPEEELGWEETPPTLPEFVRRDLRWCQGNMQYWPLLLMPGLKPVSRYQLAFAVLMFLGSPAWIGMLVVATLALALAGAPSDFICPEAGFALFVLVALMGFAPQLATAADALTRQSSRRRYGGALLLVSNLAIQFVFSMLLAPIMWFSHTAFLARLLFRHPIGWRGQARDDHAVPLRLALRFLWPQTALGLGLIGLLAVSHPIAIPVALYFVAGLALAVPLAVVTALPAVGTAFVRAGLGRLPEETAPPVAMNVLGLPALGAAAALPRTRPA